jgi:hypothetical protein
MRIVYQPPPPFVYHPTVKTKVLCNIDNPAKIITISEKIWLKQKKRAYMRRGRKITPTIAVVEYL